MKSEVKKLAKSQVEITIEVSLEEIKSYLDKAVSKISQEIKIEGFRPGKAPYEIIKQKVGDMGILQEALDDIISATYYEVLKEQKIVTIGQPQIDIVKVAPNNPFVYKATAAVLPKVKVGDYKKIKIKREPIKIGDEPVDKILADIRKMRATEKLVDQPAKAGHKLTIDFEVFLNGVPIERGQHQKYPIVIGENKFIPGFEDQLIGLKAGETKEFKLKFPEKYFEKKLANKEAEFKVNCQAVYELELPELNNELAKSISADKFQTLSELKNNIQENLKTEETTKQEQRLEV